MLKCSTKWKSRHLKSYDTVSLTSVKGKYSLCFTNSRSQTSLDCHPKRKGRNNINTLKNIKRVYSPFKKWKVGISFTFCLSGTVWLWLGKFVCWHCPFKYFCLLATVVCRAGHATTLPRQSDHVFRPQNCW